VAKLAVGLSGGVDSAVAAALLLDSGHDLVAVTMKIWDGRPMPESTRHACYGPGEEEDIEDAGRVAEHLGIPFHVVDLVESYNACVLDFCRSQYQSGKTPNPCVHCNAAIKFGGIPSALRAQGVAVDGLATGHYARVEYDDQRQRYLLRKGTDASKDQSYFLYRLGQEQLAGAHFPLGSWNKSDVRADAERRGLPVADKAESQDFVDGGYRAIFGGETRPGSILDEQGNVLGEHQGVHLYTIGQRRGLGIAHEHRLYVTDLDAERNVVTVGPVDSLSASELVADTLTWISVERLEQPLRAAVRIRYRHTESPALVEPISEETVRVIFDQPQQAITPGQAVVIYDGDVVVGGGLIQ